MELKDLDRTQQEYVNLCQEWMAVPTLNFFERSLVEQLLAAAEKSVETFDDLRRFILTMFHAEIWSAIQKARIHNVGQP